MLGQSHYTVVLRQIFPAVTGAPQYELSQTQTTTIGRDPSCQIFLDSDQYRSVSRRHAEIRVYAGSFQICDLGSSNGTYVNNQRIQGCQALNASDRIKLGHDGPEFIVEQRAAQGATVISDNREAVPVTVFETNTPPANLPGSVPVVNSTPNPMTAPAANSTSSNQPNSSLIWKVVAGVAACVALLTLLPRSQTTGSNNNPSTTPTTASAPNTRDNEPSLPTNSEPSESPTKPRRTITVDTSELDRAFQVTSKFKEYQNIEVRNSSGNTSKVDVLTFDVKAQNDLGANDTQFVAQFLDSSGNEISNKAQLYYKPRPSEWKQGTQSKAFFVLPSDRSNLKTVKIAARS